MPTVTEIIDKAWAVHGHLTNLDEEEWDESMLSDYFDDLEGKLEGIKHIMSQSNATAAYLKKEEATLSARRKHQERKVAWMKELALSLMQNHHAATGLERVKTDRFAAKLTDSQGKVVIDDVNDIPDGYFEAQLPCLDRRAVGRDLKLGTSIPGCHLDKGQHVRWS